MISVIFSATLVFSCGNFNFFSICHFQNFGQKMTKSQIINFVKITREKIFDFQIFGLKFILNQFQPKKFFCLIFLFFVIISFKYEREGASNFSDILILWTWKQEVLVLSSNFILSYSSQKTNWTSSESYLTYRFLKILFFKWGPNCAETRDSVQFGPHQREFQKYTNLELNSKVF